MCLLSMILLWLYEWHAEYSNTLSLLETIEFSTVCKWDSLISVIKLVRERLDSVAVVCKWRVRQKPKSEQTK